MTLGGWLEVRGVAEWRDVVNAISGGRPRFRSNIIPPRQQATAEPIEHNGQIDEAARHRDVGDIHRPHLVWPCDLDAAQQIRIDLVPRRGLRRTRTAIERLYPHPLHQRLHVTTADLAPL